MFHQRQYVARRDCHREIPEKGLFIHDVISIMMNEQEQKRTPSTV